MCCAMHAVHVMLKIAYVSNNRFKGYKGHLLLLSQQQNRRTVNKRGRFFVCFLYGVSNVHRCATGTVPVDSCFQAPDRLVHGEGKQAWY